MKRELGQNRVIDDREADQQLMNPVRHTELPDGSAQIDAAAWESLYGELKALARRKLLAESSADLLQPTALVNEAWLRLAEHRTCGATAGTSCAWPRA